MLEIIWPHCIARSAPDVDHQRAVAAAIRKPSSDWKRPPGRPNHVWLRAIESDLRLLDIGSFYAWKKAVSREQWRSTADTAIYTLKKSIPRREGQQVRKNPSLIFSDISFVTFIAREKQKI